MSSGTETNLPFSARISAFPGIQKITNQKLEKAVAVSGILSGVPEELSDPRHRNHKLLAMANHNFEVASFSRRNRNENAVLEVFSESQ